MSRASEHKEKVRQANSEEHKNVLTNTLSQVVSELKDKTSQREKLISDIIELTDKLSVLKQEASEAVALKDAAQEQLVVINDLLSKAENTLKFAEDSIISTVEAIEDSEMKYEERKKVLESKLLEAQNRVIMETEKIKLPEENMRKREQQLMAYERDLKILDTRIRNQFRKLYPDGQIPLKYVNL